MSWQTVRLGDIATFSNGVNFGKEAYGAGVKLIGVSDFGDKYYPDYSTLSEVIPDVVHDRALLKPGDIVFVRSNGNKALVGRCMLLTDECESVTFSGFCIRARLNDTSRWSPRFFTYYFKSVGFRKSISSSTAGTNIQNLNQGILSSHTAQVPDYETQCRIADILDQYSNLIENNRKQISLLEEAAQRLYKEWFVDLRFPGHESTRISEGLPNGWTEAMLKDIADVVMGQSPKSEYYNDTGEGLPFHQGVSSFGLRFVRDETYTTSVTRIGKAGSILFSVRAPVGRLNYTKNEIVLGRGLAAMNHRQGLQSYLYYMLKERFFKEDMIGNGSIFASISKGDLLAQKFVVPDGAMAERFNTLCRPIDKQIERCDDAIRAATEARDRLLPKLMSGEIEAL